MSGKFATAVVACVLLVAPAASAHRIDEYLQATLLSLEPDRVQASMRMIPGVMVSAAVIAAIDSNGDGMFSESEERAYAQRVLGDLSVTVDGKRVETKLLACSFPQPAELRDGLGEIHIDYTAELPRGSADRGVVRIGERGALRTLVLVNHHLAGRSVYLVNVLAPVDSSLRVVEQKRSADQTLYQLDYAQTATAGAPAATPWERVSARLSAVQFSSLFHLGMRHIASGTDHLLFLLTLLLPAPLLAAGRRWGKPAGLRPSLLHIFGIVTAFTIGHSITLTLAALGAFHVPSRPVEVLIAISILVSAWHALRPVVPGKEALIAGFFGLIHGLAFAATLDRLGLARWERVAGILSFNLGIEAMQMLVVAALLPSLILLSRTRAYSFLRVGGAVFAGIASLGWMVERIFDRQLPVDTSVDMIMDALARQSFWFVIGLFILSVAIRLLPRSRSQQAMQARTVNVLRTAR